MEESNNGMVWLLAAWGAALVLYAGYAIWVLQRRSRAAVELSRLQGSPTSRP